MSSELRAVVYQGLAYVMQLGFMFLVARQFGPELQGDYAVVRTTVFLAESFMWFGLTTGTVYAIGSNFNKYHAPLVVFSTTYIYIIAGVLLIAGLAAGPWASIPVDWNRIVLWILSLGLFQVFQKIFLGQGRFDLFNFLNIANAALLFMFFISVGLFDSQNLDNLVSIHVLANTICSTLALAFHTDAVRKIRLRAALDRASLSKILSVGFKGYVSSVVFMLLYRVDFYIVGFFLDRAALGRYTVAVLIVEAMQKVSSWLATVLSSKVAGGHDREGVITRRFAFIAMLSVVVLASLLGFLDLVSYDYVTHWLGADYQGANLIVLALVPKAIAYAVMVVLAGHLAGRGYTYYHPLAGVCALAVLVAIDLPLIERIGIWAAVAAATLAMATAAIVMYRGVQIATRSPSLSIG